MSTFGVVALTALASLFFLLFLGAELALLYVAVRLYRAFPILESRMTSLTDQISQELSAHRSEMTEQVAKINGDGLRESSRAIVLAAQRIEKAALAFGELTSQLLAAEAPLDKGATLPPDEYAKPDHPGERWVTRNPASEGDYLAAIAEAEGTDTLQG